MSHFVTSRLCHCQFRVQFALNDTNEFSDWKLHLMFDAGPMSNAMHEMDSVFIPIAFALSLSLSSIPSNGISVSRQLGCSCYMIHKDEANVFFPIGIAQTDRDLLIRLLTVCVRCEQLKTTGESFAFSIFLNQTKCQYFHFN